MEHRLCSLIKHLALNQEGAVAIIFALFLNVMIIILALALDMGRAFEAHTEMQSAASAASIASAMEEGDQAEALDYFAANLPTGMHSIKYNLSSDVVVTVSNGTVAVTPTRFDVPAFFAPAIQPKGTAVIKVSSNSVAGLPTAGILPASLSMVLDKSGSMDERDAGTCPVSGTPSCMRIEALHEAVTKLIGNISKLPNAKQNYSIAGVPWSDDIYQPFPYQDDFPDAIKRFDAALFPAGSTCAQCGLHQASVYLPLSPQKRRIVVFMTDGEANHADQLGLIQTPSGTPPGWIGGSAAEPVRKAIWECYQMKVAYPDISIWAISFGHPLVGVFENMMRFCATDPTQYVHAPDGKTLDTIFGQVLTQLSEVRLLN